MGSPTVTPLNEIRHDGGFLISEANGHRSRDSVTVTGAAKVLAGTVLGLVTLGTTAVAAALGTNTGNGVFGAVTVNSTPTEVGVYSLVYTDATHFKVTAPSGASSTGVNGTAFSALGIGFTMTTGGTAMVAGDSFTITVTGVIGKPTAASVAAGGNTGNSTSSAVTTAGYAAVPGVYTVSMTGAVANLGEFVVEDPLGATVGHGNVGTAFVGGGLTFTIADGSTDFLPGDQFTVIVAAGSSKAAPWNPASATGLAAVAGILFGTRDATSADQPGVMVSRSCEVNASELIWPTGASAAAIAAGTAQLKSIGIIAR